MSIYQKLLKIQENVTLLRKDGTGHGYKYTTADSLFSVIRPVMDEIGLLLFQEILESTSEHVMWKTSRSDKQQTFCSCKFKFTWVDVDTGEKVEHTFHADGFNDWDKAIGSAMTYAERYYILKQFHIPTSELDPDARKEPKEPSFFDKLDKAKDVLGVDKYEAVIKDSGHTSSTLPLDTIGRNALLNALREEAKHD